MPRKMARQTLERHAGACYARSLPYLGSGLLGSPENRYNLPHFRVHPGNPSFDCASIASSLLQFCEQPIHYPKKSRRTLFNYLTV
jgi:hypothetical protein